jgi:hypothetical protein
MKYPHLSFSALLPVRFGGALALLALGLTSAQAEDRALCIGVNDYPELRPGTALRGPTSDAQLMADKLKKFGFAQPRLLLNEKATRSAIVAAIKDLGKGANAQDRLVIYFAGHGTRATNGKSTILPYDAKDVDEKFDIGCDEFYTLVKGLPGLKTIIMDSCHSGGMARDEKSLKAWSNFRPRFYARTAQLKRKTAQATKGDGFSFQEVEINGADDLKPVLEPKPTTTAAAPTTGTASKPTKLTTQTGAEIVYFTAALKTQLANESDDWEDGKTHGVFTWYLAKSLDKRGGKKPGAWGSVLQEVGAQVKELTLEEQTPLLFPPTAYAKDAFAEEGDLPATVTGNTAATNATPVAPVAPVGATVASPADAYAVSAPNPAVLSLRRKPDISPVPVNSKTEFEVTVGKAGYLVLINRDPKRELTVLFPASAKVDEAQVGPGTLRFPKKPTAYYKPDTPGNDGLKAILFTSREAADAFLKPFAKNAASGGNGTLTTAQAKGDWGEEEIAPAQVVTSEVLTLIVPADGTPAPLPQPDTKPASPASK